jgi:hypothetical protein
LKIFIDVNVCIGDDKTQRLGRESPVLNVARSSAEIESWTARTGVTWSGRVAVSQTAQRLTKKTRFNHGLQVAH